MIDKSQDYRYQNSTIEIWYLRKTAEGNATFNTNSVTTFKAAATTIPFVVRNAPKREGELQVDRSEFHIWRAVSKGITPALGDKLWDGEFFWLVERVEFMDRDDLRDYNRFRLTVLRSKLTTVP